MKNWIQSVFAAVLVCVWAVPPQAYALPSPASVEKTLEAAFKAEKATGLTVKVRNEQGELLTMFVVPPTENLTPYLPSKISSTLKSAAAMVGKTALQKLMRFPGESLGFFISLGAVVTYDLMMNAANNPVGYEQLIDSQLDPVGQLGFYAFMLANGVAAEPFMHMIQNGRLNPRFAPFITYAGMSIGMVASNIVHEIGHWPGLRQCAKELWSNSKDSKKNQLENCDKASQALSGRGGFGGIISNEWTPGLISLIGSTVLASALQGLGKVILSRTGQGLIALVVYTGEWTITQVIRSTAVELAFVILPGGLYVKGIRLIAPIAGFLAQMTLFNGVQQWLEFQVTGAYKNYFQSGGFQDLDAKVIKDLLQAKNRGWDKDSSEAMKKDVLAFSKMMQDWRQMNMIDVLQSQANWEQKLGQLTMMYSSSERFYSDFIDRIWQRKYGPYRNAYASKQAVSILDQNFPLNGVTVAPAEAADETTWLEAPDMIEQRQIITIQKVVQSFKPSQLSQGDAQILNSLINELRQEDRVKLGNALDKLNCLVHRATNSNCKWQSISVDLSRNLIGLRNSLGNPNPIWQPGLGYIIAYNNTPANKALNEKTLFQKSWGTISTPTLPESMIASMFYGPDVEKGESAVQTNNGFKDLFRAPRIRAEDKWAPNTQVHALSAPIPDIFNTNLYTYFNRGYVRASVLGQDDKTFQNWWKKYPETQYLQAWLDYERLYQRNIARLIDAMHGDNISFSKTVEDWWKGRNDGDTSIMNHGPIANGLLKSQQQEIRFYAMVLGEVMKDAFFLQSGKAPESAFQDEGKLLNTQKEGDGVQLLSYLKLNTIVDFASYMKVQKVAVNPSLDFANRRNLAWQVQLLSQFDVIHDLFKKLKVQQIPLRAGSVENMPVSTLESKDLQNKVDSLKKYLAQLKETVFPNQLLLNESQKAVVEACFQGLQQSLSEMTSFAEAANAASYVERHDAQGFTSRRCVNAPRAAGLSGVQAVQRALEGC